MLSVIKVIGGPGSVGFLLLALGSLLLLRYGSRRPGVRLAAATGIVSVLGSYALLSLPLVANGLIDALPDVTVATVEEEHAIQTLFILDGENKIGRARKAAEVARDGSLTSIQMLGNGMFEDLAREQVPMRLVKYSRSGGNTGAQLVHLQRLAATLAQPAGVVASRVSMPRIAAFAKTQGLSIRLVSAPLDWEPARAGLRRFLPAYAALMASRDAIYEHAAIFYYQRRGFVTN